MTGGTVLVLGKTGRNFAAGMSGGIAYVYDEDGEFASRCNTTMVSLEPWAPRPSRRPAARPGCTRTRRTKHCSASCCEDHNRWTGSRRARELLDNWAVARTKFVKVFPNEYKRALAEMYEREVEAASAGNNAQVAMKHDSVAAAERTALKDRTRSGPATRKNMGKITGFMEFERVEEGYRPIPERVKNYKEFVIGLSDEQAKIQGARCMDCGTPFCNSGCPVNNIIPDFNDLVYRQDWQNASTVLDSTNNFPGVHRPHLPRALRGGLHAERQRRPGGHQVDRARDHRPRLGARLGAAARRPRSRPARRWPWSAPAPPAWPRRSNWRAPAMT